MDKPDIPFLSATELSQLIKKKEVPPDEATEAYLDRIDVQDFKIQLLPHRMSANRLSRLPGRRSRPSARVITWGPCTVSP